MTYRRQRVRYVSTLEAALTYQRVAINVKHETAPVGQKPIRSPRCCLRNCPRKIARNWLVRPPASALHTRTRDIRPNSQPRRLRALAGAPDAFPRAVQRTGVTCPRYGTSRARGAQGAGREPTASSRRAATPSKSQASPVRRALHRWGPRLARISPEDHARPCGI